MKETTKKAFKTLGLIGFGWMMGNIKGIVDCSRSIGKKLEEDHGLTVDEVYWKPTGKILKVEISKINKGEAEETK